MSTGDTWRLGHRPALDGLRGIAVLMVVAAHLLPDQLISLGVVGVTIFFTLSGFLITSLLLEERVRGGRINLGRFYLRRARRLLPALLAFLVVMTALGAFVAPVFAPAGSVLPVLLYVGNWWPATGHLLGGLGHTWSLAVEEQFYIAYPLLVILLLGKSKQRVLLWATALGVAASFAARVGLWLGGSTIDRVYVGTDTNAGGLLAGCLLAIVLQGTTNAAARPRVALIAVSATAVLGLAGHSFAARVFVPILATVAAVITIAALVRGDYHGRFAARWLVYVGRRSYALYLWHFPLLIYVLPQLRLPWPMAAALMVGVALALTELSWRYVETPFLRRRVERPDSARAHLGLQERAAAK